MRLVQEYSNRDRINFHRRRVAIRLFLERARDQVEQGRDHTFSNDVQAEIAARIYFSRDENASCDICKEECPDFFHHSTVSFAMTTATMSAKRA